MVNIFTREFFLYFWIPRIVITIIISIFFNNLHISGEELFRPSTILISPDLNSYTKSISINPLFSISLRFLNIFKGSVFLKIILGELISGWACLNIYHSLKNMLNLKKSALLIMGINPILSLYSIKFTTENFSLLALSYFVSFRANKFTNPKENLSSFNFSIKKIFIMISLTLFRAQNLILLICESFLSLKDLIQKKSLKKQKYNFYFARYIFLLMFIFTIIIFINRDQISSFLMMFWDSNYPIKPYDINSKICSLQICRNWISSFFIKIISLIIYLFVAIFLITGARGRFSDLPWKLEFNNITLLHTQNISILNENVLEDFDETAFLIKVILPLFIFSIFNLLGMFFWIKYSLKFGLVFSLMPLSICLIPLLTLPYIRYFIPLIPLSCIGMSIALDRKSFFSNKYLNLQ